MKMLKTTPKGSMYSRRLPVAVLDLTPLWQAGTQPGLGCW